MELRDYQQDILNQVQDRDIVCLPTGTGKSAIIATLAKQFQYKGTVAIIVPTIELKHQMAETLKKWNCPTKRVKISVWLSASKIEADFWLHDECHHSASQTWEKLLDKPGHHIGFSATPLRLDGKPLKGFKRVLEPYDIRYFMSKGYLCGNLKEFTINLSCDLSGTGDDVELQFQKLNRQYIYAQIVQEFKKHSNPNTKAIVYGTTIKHCYVIARQFTDSGFNVGVIHSELGSQERQALLTDFRKGVIRILINVLILTEGVDIPDADMVLMCRRVYSKALYYQMVGRALRPKPSATILDFVGNLDIHGSVKTCLGWQDDFDAAIAKEVEETTRILVCAKCGQPKTFGQPCLNCGSEIETMTKPLPTQLNYTLTEYSLSAYQQALHKLRLIDDRQLLIKKLIKARCLMTGVLDAVYLQQFLDNRFSDRLSQKIYSQVMGD